MYKAVLSSLVVATLAGSAFAGRAAPAVEIEVNETKAAADTNNNIDLPASSLLGALSGSTQGSSGFTPGQPLPPESLTQDMWRLNTPGKSEGIYLNRLTINSTAYTTRLVGASSSNPDNGFNVIQAGVASGNFKQNQWYSFAPATSMYYVVQGNGNTSGNYSVNYTVSSVTPTALTGAPAPAGTYTFKTGGNQDTEMFLYSSAGVLVGANDDAIGGADGNSKIVASLTNGTYFLAVARYNTAADRAYDAEGSGTQFASRGLAALSAAYTDYAGNLVAGNDPMSTGLFVDYGDFRVYSNDSTATGQSVAWYSIEVVPTPGAAMVLGLGGLVAGRRRR